MKLLDELKAEEEKLRGIKVKQTARYSTSEEKMIYEKIDPDATYAAASPALDILGKEQTRARLRCEGKGAPYIKLGGRVLYRGKDVIAFLEANTVTPDKPA